LTVLDLDVELAHVIAAIVTDLDRRFPWRKDALCREHPELSWFVPRGDDPRDAKGVCGRCRVAGECRSYAVAWGAKAGIWGGHGIRLRVR
jgi:hypothetical protein